MTQFPKDSKSRRIDARARAILHYHIDSNCWIYREQTGQDVGCDCRLELAENNNFKNLIIEGQIKGTGNLDRYLLKNDSLISFPLEIKTINYGLGSSNPFVLFLVDVAAETVYYFAIQESFIANKSLFDRLEQIATKNPTQKTLNLKIPVKDRLEVASEALKELACKTYVCGPSRSLKVAE